MTDLLLKARDLLIHQQDDEEEDEEFIEVPIEHPKKTKGKQVARPTTQSITPGLKPVFKSRQDLDPLVPTKDLNNSSQYKYMDGQNQLGRAHQDPLVPQVVESIHPTAPIVPYGEDLRFWSTDKVTFEQVSLHSGMAFKHRFYGEGPVDKELSEETIQRLKQRSFYIEPKPLGEIMPCRAPLKNGTLCSRKDLVKCPFHGPIVERDDYGIPLNPVEIVKEESVPIWQTIEQQVNQTFSLENESKKRKSKLETPIVKKSVKKRLLDKLASSKDDSNHEQDLAYRDRMAFRW